ncbi:PIGR protein, partial [Polypterus senegalus]
MYDLTVNDTGCYKCKSRWYTKSINCPVNLQVLDLEILKVQNTMEKTVGSPAMLECHYKPQYVEYEKYWCKLEINGKCQSVDSNRDGQKRWEVNDKTNNYTLTLYTRTLTMEDAGQYQCGIRRSEYPIDTVQVQLRVLPNIEESSSDSSECSEDTPVVRVKERCNDDYVNVDKELRKEDDDYVNMVSPDGERPESKGSPKLTCDYVNVEPLDSSESEEEEEEKKEEVDKEPESSDLNPSRRLYKLQKSQQSDSSDSEGDTVEYTQIVFH